MNRMKLLAGAIALAIPSLALAQGDASNPSGSPVAPSLGTTSQPQQGELMPAVRAPELRDPATPIAPMSAEETARAEAERISREAASKPKPARTVRMGGRTMALATASASEIASR